MLLTLPLFILLNHTTTLNNSNIFKNNTKLILPKTKSESYEKNLEQKNKDFAKKDFSEKRNDTSLKFVNSIIPIKFKDSKSLRLKENGLVLSNSSLISNEDYFKEMIIIENLEKAIELRKSARRTEELLYKTLLNPLYYEKNVRPTPHHSISTNITFGVLLNQIVEMDERNQVLTTRCWINTNWLDKRLSWNASAWEGIKQIYIPYEKIWRPDIILINNAAREYYGSVLSTDIMVTDEGNVTWLFSALFKSNCAIKVRYYPFDDQECTLKFASWGTHDMSELNIGLNTEKGDLSNYMNNSEFDLIDMRAKRTVIRFPTDIDTSWPMIVIYIRMHRRPLFYVFNHILPCVLISSMALLGFFMPPETGEKINMLNTVILSMGVYLQSITESIPPTSEAVPLIGMYYVASLFIVCLATTVNVATLNIHRSGAANQGRHVPWWMEKYILGYMATMLCMRIHEPDSVTLLKTSTAKQSIIRRSSLLRDLKRIKNIENRRGGHHLKRDLCECLASSVLDAKKCSKNIEDAHNEIELREVSPKNHKRATRDASTGESAFLGKVVKEQLLPRIHASQPAMLTEFEERFRKILKRIYRSLQQYEIREEVLDERKRIMWQWKALASVIDRFLLILFSLATFLTFAFLLVLPVAFRDGYSF